MHVSLDLSLPANQNLNCLLCVSSSEIDTIARWENSVALAWTPGITAFRIYQRIGFAQCLVAYGDIRNDVRRMVPLCQLLPVVFGPSALRTGRY